MKFYAFVFLLMISPIHSTLGQTHSVQSTPIAVSGDGLAGELGEDEEVMKAREELAQSRIRPVANGEQEESDKVITEKKGQLVPPLGHIQKSSPKRGPIRLKERYLLARVGLINSSWSSLSKELDNGSTVLGFGVYQVINDSLGAAVVFEVSHPMKGDLVPEETRFFNVKLEGDYLWRLHDNFRFMTGLSLSMSDYNIRRKIQTTPDTETYRRFGDGFAFGLIPHLGVRSEFSPRAFLDLKLIYPLYFASPRKYYNGVGGQLTLHLTL